MIYDFLIVGGGPAGLSAAIYAARFKLNTIIIAERVGGTILSAHLIENYPGFKSGSPMDLIDIMRKQVESYKVPIIEDRVINIDKKKDNFLVKTGGKEYETKALLIATGTSWRKLDVKGAKEFENKGISYCAVCDAPLFRDKVVGVVGGSDSAATEALLLTEYAKKVYIIYRGDKIRAEPINAERVEKNNKIEVITKANVVEVKGKNLVEEVVLDTGKTLKLSGLFIEIGNVPNSLLLKNISVKCDDKEQIIVDESMQTNIQGVYAAGDVTNSTWKQVVNATYQGSKAANTAYLYIKNKK